MPRLPASVTIAGMAIALEQVRVVDVMHPGTVTCPPETSLRTVARMMAAYRIHCVVVLVDIDEAAFDARLCGVVSDLDLVGAAGAELDERTAGGTASTPLVTVGPSETLERAAQLMAEYQTSHLVVVEPASGRPVGVLSTLDIAGEIARR